MLDEILAAKEKELARLRRRRDRLEREARDAPEPRDFRAALGGSPEVAVVAEFKRRSPSAGDVAPGASAGAVAAAYQEGGAAALSVLTDGPFFDGSLDDLEEARNASDLPVLRKDFLVDPVQVLEARVAGADAVLLIARVLPDEALAEMLEAVREVRLAALVEVHSGDELDRAVGAGARAVGVNARDLDSFAVDLALSEELLARVPADRLAVAESGIRGANDVRRMARAGADAVLVGGWLMRRDPSDVERLTGVPREGRSGGA